MKALVPLDGSPNAIRVMSTVRRLVELQPGIEVHLATILDPKTVHGRQEHVLVDVPAASAGRLHVSAPLPRLVESHGEAMERMAMEARNWLIDLAHRELPSAVIASHTAWSDHAAEGIIALADQLDADLIVMAAHGRSGISHLVAGSVTEAVIRTSPRPVLVQGPAAL